MPANRIQRVRRGRWPDRSLAVGAKASANRVSRSASAAAEYQEWADSDLEWTLVRAPRLRDGPPTHAVEDDAHRSAPSPFLRRSDLAEFLVDVLEQGLYIRQAPLVGAKAVSDGPVPE
jgi:NAD(P)H-binding